LWEYRRRETLWEYRRPESKTFLDFSDPQSAREAYLGTQGKDPSMMGEIYTLEQFRKLAEAGGLAKPISEKPYTARTTGAEKPQGAPGAQKPANEAKSARKMGPESATQEAPPPS
jgi:hypothetical protein